MGKKKQKKSVQIRRWWVSRTPDGRMWVETPSINELLEQSDKWDGEGELTFERHEMRIVTHEPTIKKFKINSINKEN
jgi:hypothetical protein